MVYKNPPLVEALCVIHFTEPYPWDLTLFGLFYERLKKDFPYKESYALMGVEQKPTDKGLEQRIESGTHLVKFFSQNRERIVQVAPRTLAISRLSNYSWEDFKKDILEISKIYTELTNYTNIKALNLAYINLIKFDSAKTHPSKYIKLYPSHITGREDFSLLLRAEIPYDKGGKLILTLNRPMEIDKNLLVFELAYSMELPEGMSFEDMEGMLDAFHYEIKRAFEESITDDARAVFGGVEHDRL